MTWKPESPKVTATWHACKHTMYKLYQRYILKMYILRMYEVCGDFYFKQEPPDCLLCLWHLKKKSALQCCLVTWCLFFHQVSGWLWGTVQFPRWLGHFITSCRRCVSFSAEQLLQSWNSESTIDNQTNIETVSEAVFGKLLKNRLELQGIMIGIMFSSSYFNSRWHLCILEDT